MNRVIPKYVPANSIEDKFGFLLTAVTVEETRVYWGRDGGWGAFTEALFYTDTLDAADTLKAVNQPDQVEQDGLKPDSIQLVKVYTFLVPTVISEEDLRRKRRAAALSKLTQDEIDALGIKSDEEDDRARFMRRTTAFVSR